MSDRILVSTRKGLFTFDREQSRWALSQSDFLGDPVTITMTRNGGETIWAGLDLGHFGCKVHRSDDAGKSWHEAACPTYPPKPSGTKEDVDPVQREPIPWSLKKIWAFAEGGGRLWCGTIPGGLFVSEDDGANWEIVDSLWSHPDRSRWFGGGADYPGIHSIIVDPTNADRITLGVSCGGVWVTVDGGKTWTCRADGMRAEYMPPDQAYDPVVQDPHRIVACSAAPQTMWCQHHNGIFLTQNYGDSWQEIENVSPSAFGFAVVVHPNDPKCAWFIPAIKDEKRYPVDGHIVVNRTQDSGETFETLSLGLPQENAYDIVYRHAFDIDGRGERLAFGSTTGSLWVSEDRGNTWLTLANHLPPIYSVQFA